MGNQGWSAGENTDGVFNPDQNDTVSSAGVVLQERSPAPAPSKQTQQQTAVRGTDGSNTNVVSADVSIHDGSGNAYTLANPLPVFVTSAAGGSTPIFTESAGTLTSLNYQQIFTFTSTDPDTKVIQVHCTAETTADFQLLLDGNPIMVKRTSPMERNIVFEFKQHRPIPTGSVLTVESRPERMFRGSYETFVSMEGYVT